MRASVVLIGLLLILSGSAQAQNPGGPFGGLFGRTPPRTGSEVTALEFRTAAAAQFDDDIPVPGFTFGGGPTSGFTTGANAALAFERRREGLRFNFRGGTTYQQFFQEPQFGATTHDLSTLISAKVGSRLTVDAGASAIRSPFYQIAAGIPVAGPMPDVPVPGAPYAVRMLGNDAFEGTAGFTSQYSKKSSLSLGISARETRFWKQPDNDFQAWGSSGLWRHRLSRDLALRLGYGREQSRTRALGASTFVHETIDAGVDFMREVSIARRTSLSGFAQTSMIKEPGADRHYRLNGGASLMRGFNRTWTGSVVFNRTTEFVAGFGTPLFSDTLSLSLGGQLAKRVEWTGSAGAGRGVVGFHGEDTFQTYSGTTRLSAGITHHMGVYAQYTYYHYEIPPGSTVVELLPMMSRQSVSIGLTAWVPIINRVRAPSDPR